MSTQVFGPGVAIVTNLSAATPTAFNLGYVNEFSLDTTYSIKELTGQNQFPIGVARGTAKVTGKMKAAVFSGQTFNACFFNQSFVSGRDIYTFNEQHTSATSTITASNAPGTGYGTIDLGVYYAATGIPLVRVASAPAQGQYAFTSNSGAAATYTIAALDENTALDINYSIFWTTSGGQQLQVTNQLIGSTPVFQLDYWSNLNQPAAKPFAIRLFQCVASKLNMAAKIEDYIMPEFDFSAFANASGQVMNINFPDLG